MYAVCLYKSMFCSVLSLVDSPSSNYSIIHVYMPTYRYSYISFIQ